MILGVAWLGAAGWWNERREENDRRPWLSEATIREELKSGFPDLPATPHTREIEARAAAVGLDLAPPRDPARAHPAAADRAKLLDVVARLSPGVAAELAKPVGEIAAPPPEVLSFFHEKGAAFDALEAWLVAAPPPQWERRFPFRSVSVPSLLELRRATELFASVALERARAGDLDGALRTLEAGWKLAEGFAARPELSSQLARVEALRRHLAALRRVDAVSPEWVERLRQADPGPQLIRSMRFEALLAEDLLGQGSPGEAGGTWARGSRWVRSGFASPGGKSEAAGLLPALLPWVASDLAADPCRDFASIGADAPGVGSGVASPHRELSIAFRHAWLRLARLRLDAEGSRKVLEARTVRAATGLWSPILPGIEASICGSSRWSWSIGGDLRPTLELEPKVELAGLAGLAIPQEWRGPER